MKSFVLFQKGWGLSRHLPSWIAGTGLVAAYVAALSGLRAAPPQLQPAVTLAVGANAIDLGDYAIPCVADWNGDGRKDLLVGYRTADKVALYLNRGTDAAPVFTNFTHLQVGGQDIAVPSYSCGAPAPWVCDFDADGRQDLLVGNGANGYVNFYRNTNTVADPRLEPAVLLTTGSSALSVAWRATPLFHDWDEDGLKDLLCGNGDGYIYFFKNTNAAQAPIFAPGMLLQAGGTTLNLSIRSVPRVFDWDGDGLKDLVGSSNAGVYWCRNTNRNNASILQAPIALQAPLAGQGLRSIYTGSRMRLDLADWNNDGVTDLLLGNADGTVYFYEGYRFTFSAVTTAAGPSVTLQWNSAPYLKYDLDSRSALVSSWSTLATNVPATNKITTWTGSKDEAMRLFRLKITP